jgi:hypothetical protein
MKSVTQYLQMMKMAIPLAVGLLLPLSALADKITVPKGTDIVLAFDQPLTDKKAKDGDKVNLHVDKDVQVDGKTVIAEGTKATGVITAVKGRARYGVNARIQMLINPITAVDGTKIPIGYKTKSADNGKTAGAAAATVGGAVVLGPIGLVGGYFVVGKHVNVKPGDKMTVTADQDEVINVK